MSAQCTKSKFGADLKTEEQQRAQLLRRRVNNGERKTPSPLCQGQVHSQLHHTWSLAVRVHVYERACVQRGMRRIVFEQCITAGILIAQDAHTHAHLHVRARTHTHHLACLSLLLVAACGSGLENSHRETNQHLHITGLAHVCHE